MLKSKDQQDTVATSARARLLDDDDRSGRSAFSFLSAAAAVSAAAAASAASYINYVAAARRDATSSSSPLDRRAISISPFPDHHKSQIHFALVCRPSFLWIATAPTRKLPAGTHIQR